MKLLLDACVWGGALQELAVAGHDVDWIGNWPRDPGDEAILSHAYSEGRILVTLDKDFGEIAVVRGLPHHGIVRLVGFSARRHAAVCSDVLAGMAPSFWRERSSPLNPGEFEFARRVLRARSAAC